LIETHKKIYYFIINYIRTEGNFHHEGGEEETEDEQGKGNSQRLEDDLIELNCVNDEPTNPNPVLEKSTSSTTVLANLRPMPKSTKKII